MTAFHCQCDDPTAPRDRGGPHASAADCGNPSVGDCFANAERRAVPKRRYACALREILDQRMEKRLDPLVEYLIEGRPGLRGFSQVVTLVRMVSEFETRVQSELLENVVDVALDRVDG